MAEVTVFVDDAVRGTLPDVCAKDGSPTTGRLRTTTEVGSSNRAGILVLLLFLGPIGWIIAIVLATRDGGERLTVALPYSDEAYDRFAAARRARNVAAGAAVAAGALTLLVVAGGSGSWLVALLLPSAVVALIATFAFGWRLERASVTVTLDASRRWVGLARVHPAFVDACRRQDRERQPSP